MAKPQVAFTYEDYCTTPEGERHELIGGDLLMVPAPSYSHQSVLVRLSTRLNAQMEATGAGKILVAPFDVILSETDVVQPDILFVAAGRLKLLKEEGLRGAPDLAVEILSPGTAARDRQAKSKLYFRHGVRELWIVDTDARRVEVFLPGKKGFALDSIYEGKAKVRSQVFSDLSLTAGELFVK